MGKTSQRKIELKRRKLCEKIIGQECTGAFMNQHIPSGIALAWTNGKNAYLVNLVRKTAKIYVKDGKFLMKRALLPLKVWVEYPERLIIDTTPEKIESIYDLDYLGEEMEKSITKSFKKDQYFD